uniref:Uncharacterized protein n=1 Tax=Poecilia formosa TaxID=48698 RepID=A0A096M2T3_POEFO
SSFFEDERPQSLYCIFLSTDEQISTWIKNNITKKECCRYVMNSNNVQFCNKEGCCSGYSELDSTDKVSKPEDFKKRTCNEDKHVHEVSTDAFGVIKFGGQKSSKYVRVFTDTKPEVLYELLTKQWKLPRPNLVISVTGGAKNFYLKSHLKKVFHRGLIKVAQTTGAWIITGGTNAGVMMHVGQAVRDCALNNTMKRKIVAIGVAPWRVIHNKDKLVNEEGCFPAQYVIDTQGQGNMACLDNNHSHFLLVDDGTNDKDAYGAEIPLRTELEQYISDQALGTEGLTTTIKTLVVCVVLDGGGGTLKTIYNAIEKGTPCVILQGSGRIADVIAQVSGLPINSITTTLIKELTKKYFGEEYKHIKDDQIEAWKNMIQKIVEKSDLLTIFRAKKDDQGVLDVAILDALLKAFKTAESQEDKSWKKHLELAITWNRVDSAETKIFTEERMWKSSDLHDFMRLALVCNKPDFVSLLLENGLCLEDFLQDNTLCDLYKNLPNSSSTRRKALDMNGLDQARKEVSLEHVSNEVRHLLGKFTKHIYPSSKSGGRNTCREDMPYIKLDVTIRSILILITQNSPPLRETWTPSRDLFLWAVVQNNKELSKIAWDQCGDCISAALAASKILKKMAEESIDADEPQEMLELASHFEDRAIGVFSKCYKNDEERAQKLLVRISSLWGETTCLRLALEANNKKFVAELGVQTFQTK